MLWIYQSKEIEIAKNVRKNAHSPYLSENDKITEYTMEDLLPHGFKF